ncbi:hypothetical protein [Phaeobacter sp. HF9A]|uniref:hypothetical protein n=1 Tax=Phaeobacter sp. HF9A TaxID=2721561 RepID=UPI00142F6E18|nr:hypothetical protein [Phaeobacter sp. HF9A]NIZ13478.1 hypothetical protein [Phaeobacter sp. HF9A]
MTETAQAPVPQDSASTYRPSINPDFIGTYADPRSATGATAERAPLTYEGPSYTERAGGDLLGTVMSDLKGIRDTQLVAMKEEFQSRVEATIGRALTEDEDLFSFATHAVMDHEDVMFGGRAQGLQYMTYFVDLDEPHTFRKGITQEYLDNTTEAQREEMLLNRYVDVRVSEIDRSIKASNDTVQKYGFGDTLLPELTDEEMATLREEVMDQTRSEVASGALILTFDYFQPTDDHR